MARNNCNRKKKYLKNKDNVLYCGMKNRKKKYLREDQKLSGTYTYILKNRLSRMM